MSEAKGISLALMTAFVSGASIFVNKFAVSGLNPFVFTTLKNVFVAMFLLSTIFLLKEFRHVRSLTRLQCAKLALIGLVGGSVPFLLFFYALKLTSAVNAGFLQKTLFAWVFLLAIVFLKEKVSKKFLLGAFLLFLANFFFFSKFTPFGFADVLVLAAAALWGVENVISKHVLNELYGRVVAWGRMFFGSIFMLGFLAVTGQLGEAFVLSFDQLAWVLITGAFLFLYVFFYYTGLKYVRVSVAAAILLLAQPVTSFLSVLYSGNFFSFSEAIGILLTVIGVAVIIGWGYFIQTGRKIRAYAFGRA